MDVRVNGLASWRGRSDADYLYDVDKSLQEIM